MLVSFSEDGDKIEKGKDLVEATGSSQKLRVKFGKVQMVVSFSEAGRQQTANKNSARKSEKILNPFLGAVETRRIKSE